MPTAGYLAILIGLVALAASPAGAKPLDQQTCLLLDQQLKAIEATGIKADLEKGPAWGRANLAQSRLDQIRIYLDIAEKVLFRCPSLSIIAAEEAAAPATAAGDTENGDPTVPAAPAPGRKRSGIPERVPPLPVRKL
jgi:hypothetical protein